MALLRNSIPKFIFLVIQAIAYLERERTWNFIEYLRLVIHGKMTEMPDKPLKPVLYNSPVVPVKEVQHEAMFAPTKDR